MIPNYPKDLLFAKEIASLVFIMLLSLLFLKDFSNELVLFCLVLGGVVLYGASVVKEKSLQASKHAYFCITSSYFLLGTLFVTLGYLAYKTVGTWETLFASLGVILFAVGLARILLADALRPYHQVFLKL